MSFNHSARLLVACALAFFPPGRQVRQPANLSALQAVLALLAVVVTGVLVIRLLRSFESKRNQQITALQADRLREAERREAMRGELLNRVVQAQEAERQRIARELHDETGQALTAIGLGLRGAAARIEAQAPKVAEQLAHLEQMTKHSLDELQRLIAGLRPSHLDDLGLAAALRWFAGEIEGHSPLEIRVQIEGPERALPPVVAVGLFRVAQEALTNVVKHASADSALVGLTYRPDRVELEVVDDGVGFDSPGADRPSWGLIGIQERVSLMGGKFELESERDQGTRVRVSVPVEPGNEQEHAHSTAAGG